MSAVNESVDILHKGDKVTVILTDIPNPPAPLTLPIRDDGWITLHLNKKVMADPRIAALAQKKMPFDCTRMVYGGFEVLVEG